MPPALLHPIATYRVHLTGAFTLDDAAALCDHLTDLGVDWLYASPIQTVPEGATHGYHVLDPDRVNPELGGEEALASLQRALQAAGLRMVLDIVPNHMGASPDNPWWADVLAGGPGSAHARTFDIDWDAGPLVLPVLGETPDEAISAGTLRIADGQVAYHDLRLPVAPGTDLAAPIEQVLEQQHYRLHEWRSGEAQLNYRRFFAVNELAGIRVEDPEVFDATHRTIFSWVEDDVVQGLRVDHIDGLADPGGYLQRIREAIGPARWLVVEKIVEQGERLPADWPVEGTTGYEAGIAVQCWLTDGDGLPALRQAFEQVTGMSGSAADALPDSKLAVLDELFPAEVARVVEAIRAVPADQLPHDLSPDDLREGIRHLTAHLSGYRTYAPPEGELRAEDVRALGDAAAAATAAGSRHAGTTAEVLMADAARPALVRWQQLTGPAAAKGFEDRLLFRHVPLSALCEVGADAALLDAPMTPRAVAEYLTDRAASSPLGGTTSSTHDTKRSEDVRARLTVLAEDARGFADLVASVSADLPAELDGHGRWLLLQAVVGSLGWEPGDLEDGVPTPAYRERLQGWAQKALREADLRTSHRDQDAAYERAAATWLDALLEPGAALDAVLGYVDRIAVAGAVNALGQVVLKVAGPGIPDVYRGCEVWDGSLTDPDNRRPVDYDRIRALAKGLDAADAAALRDGWRDGAVKLLVTRQALRARRDRPAVCCSTWCTAPPVGGEGQAHVAALLRRATDTGPAGVADPAGEPRLLAVATRLPLALAGRAGDRAGWPLGTAAWGATALDLTDEATAGGPPPTSATDLLTGADVPVDAGNIRLADALSVLPVCLLELR
jgi:(1->4)-alpha-D-glucan 1-alpha-D-glucosylmutase